MPRKSALSIENLTKIPAEKLVQLVSDEAERNPGFRRRVKAALAAKSGPEGVAKLIDRRLSGLERAKSPIDWNKARAFSDDLQSLTNTIEADLAPAAPHMAVDRFIRFIATRERVFERAYDSSGQIQEVYIQAIAGVGNLAENLNTTEADLLPGKIMAQLGEPRNGYLVEVTEAVAPHLSQPTLTKWDADLSAAIEQRKAEEAEQSLDRWFSSITREWTEMRQLIALARGDIDLLVALESAKKLRMQDSLRIAEHLLDAGRAAEALKWVRKSGTHAQEQDDPQAQKKVQLEARILEALDDKPAAQNQRWQYFEKTLSADILRDYLKLLPDFDDIEAEENALQLGLSHPDPNAALRFYVDWQRLDLAAQVVTRHHTHWNGSYWHTLPKVAETLEHEHPEAATILYRALLNGILIRARTRAYRHGGEYLGKLVLMAKDADPLLPKDVVSHKTYLTELRSTHSRKYKFWERIR